MEYAGQREEMLAASLAFAREHLAAGETDHHDDGALRPTTKETDRP